MGAGGAAATSRWCHALPTGPGPRRGVPGGVAARSLLRGGPGPRGAAGRDAPLLRRADDGQVALAVGAVDRHPGAGQPGEQPRCRVAVGVVRADRHQRDPGAGRGQERRVGVGAAVVRDLEDVGAQVDAAGEHACLGGRAQVAGEQDPHAALGHPHDQRQVVGLGGRRRDLRGRRQDLQRRAAHGPDVAGHQHLAPRAGPLGEGVEGGQPVVGRGQRAGGDRADVAALERTGQPAGVVGVEVGQQDQRQRVDAEPVEAAVDRADLGAGVDEHALPGSGGHDQPVALSHVTGDEDGSGRRPPVGRLAQRPAEHHETHRGSEGQGAQAPVPPEEEAEDEQHHGEQQRAAGARRPADRAVGQPGGDPGDGHQPPHRPAGQPGERVTGRRHHRAGEGGEQAEHRRGRHGRCGEEVGRQRDRADQPRQAGDERRGGQAGGRRHGHRVGDRARPAAAPQPARPARGEQHDGRRGADGEREAGVAGQAGVEQQQDGHRGRERRHRDPGAPGRQREQADRAHRGGPYDARAGPGQHDEAGQRDQRHQRLDAPVDGPAAQRREDAGQHDRDVRAGHRGQVGQAGAAEVLGENRVHRPRVPHDQPGQQPRRGVAEHPRRRVGQSVAQTAGELLHPRYRADGLGRPARREPGDHVLGRRRDRDGGAGTHLLTGQQVRPALLGCEDDHPGGQVHPAVAVLEDGDRGVECQARRRGGTDPPRVTVDLQDHRHRPLAGHLRQRRGRAGGAPDGGGPGRRGDRGQDGERHQDPRPVAGTEQDGRGEDRPGCHDRRHERRQRRGGQRDGPDRDGDRDEAEVHPRPPALRTAAHTRTRSARSA